MSERTKTKSSKSNAEQLSFPFMANERSNEAPPSRSQK